MSYTDKPEWADEINGLVSRGGTVATTPSGVKVVKVDWDPNLRSEYGLAVRFYANGVRKTRLRDGTYIEKSVRPVKQLERFYNSIRFASQLAKEGGVVSPIVVYIDGSPVVPDLERMLEAAGGLPFAVIIPPDNQGCGAGENIVQHALSSVCKYLIRWDADVELNPFDIHDIAKAFKTIEEDPNEPGAFALSSNITMFARLFAKDLPDEVRYFSGANMADLVIYDTEVLREVGYADPVLYVNEDGELRLRAESATGKRVYVDKLITGKAAPSGANSNTERRKLVGKYIKATRPWITTVFPKKGMFRLRMGGKAVRHLGQGRVWGPHIWGQEAAEALWGQGVPVVPEGGDIHPPVPPYYFEMRELIVDMLDEGPPMSPAELYDELDRTIGVDMDSVIVTLGLMSKDGSVYKASEIGYSTH